MWFGQISIMDSFCNIDEKSVEVVDEEPFELDKMNDIKQKRRGDFYESWIS